MEKFKELGLEGEILKGIEDLGFEVPSPVQEKVIPVILGEENDLVALAQTGTGKTAAFGLPLLQKLDTSLNAIQVLILSPTRELCMQIGKDCGHTCCWKCCNHGTCTLECSSSKNRPESEEVKPQKKAETSTVVEYDRKTLENLIKDAEHTLNLMQDYWIQNQPYTYAKHFMQLQAYKMLLDYHEKLDKEEVEEVVQPELPLLKNNDQRKEWLKNYRTWGLWYEDEHIGMAYYRFILPDGAQIIADEYLEPISRGVYEPTSKFHLVGGDKNRYNYHAAYALIGESETEIINYLKKFKNERVK